MKLKRAIRTVLHCSIVSGFIPISVSSHFLPPSLFLTTFISSHTNSSTSFLLVCISCYPWPDVALGVLSLIGSHKDHQLTFLTLLPTPSPPPFSHCPFIPKCLLYCVAYIPLLCLSPNVTLRKVQLLSHNRVCLHFLVLGQLFHYYSFFCILWPSLLRSSSCYPFSVPYKTNPSLIKVYFLRSGNQTKREEMHSWSRLLGDLVSTFQAATFTSFDYASTPATGNMLSGCPSVPYS